MLRVCLVEDEQSLIELISLNLEMEGYHVQCFTDGQTALEAFEKPFHFERAGAIVLKGFWVDHIGR